MKCKKITAILLAVVLFCSVFAPAVFAADVKDTPDEPIVFVHGYMASSLYYNPNSEDRAELFPPSQDSIMKIIPKAIPALTALAMSKRTEADWDRFTDAAEVIVNELVGDSFCDTNGDVLENTGAKNAYPSKESVIADYQNSEEISFKYDWRLSPLVLSEQLHDFIEYVKECTGRDKVNLICHSFGSCVGITYIAKYGLDSIDGVVLHAAAFMGASYDGEMMSGDVAFNGDALANTLKDMVLTDSEYSETWRSAITALEATGLFAKSEIITDYILDQALDMVIKKILSRWFAQSPSIWAMVPDDMYEGCRDYIFNYALKDVECDGLIAKLDEYDSLVRNHREELLDLIANNVNFGVVAKYNIQKVPITSKSRSLSDNIIDTSAASLGATTANYGETLPADYQQQKHTDVNYISPDRMIDASTCRYPERTWFIKNFYHASECDDLQELFLRILSNDDYTVTSDPDYPQFLTYDDRTEVISALTAENGSSASENKLANFIKFLRLFFEKLIAFVKSRIHKTF